MGFVGSMLGNRSGAGFQASGPSDGQLQDASKQIGIAREQQQEFLDMIRAQNGLGNQTSVFNQQQGLADQLQGVANGTGPNAALAQLNQQTGKNISSQAALMAGQRGSSANAGLIARQAALQGGNLQQQAVGQGASMQAQQQLAAMQQLQGQQASMGNLATNQVNQRQAATSALNQSALQNQANLFGLQANVNNANAAIAGENQKAQGNVLGNMMGGIGSAAGLLGRFGSSGGQTMQSGADDVNGSGPAGPGGGEQVLPATGGIGDSAGMAGGAKGGLVHKYADGGMAQDSLPVNPLLPTTQAPIVTLAPTPTDGPQSNVGKMFDSSGPAPRPAAASSSPLDGGIPGMPGGGGGGGSSSSSSGAAPEQKSHAGSQILGTVGSVGGGILGGMFGGPWGAVGGSMAGGVLGKGVGGLMDKAEGGIVPAMVSPGEQYIPPEDIHKVKKGANPLEVGERIPGKPKHPGNDYRNDVVRKDLESGGVVIPNKIMQSKDAGEKARKFVEACLAKNRMKKSK